MVASAFAATPQELIEQGRRIYRDGVLPSGEPLRARVAGGAALMGAQAACQNCHRRSGLGTSEGGRVVPSIAGETLFRPRQPGKLLTSAPVASAPGARPAYGASTLTRALNEGIEPAGRTLGELMPRYELDGPSVNALSRYLRTLSTRNSAGVNANEMHLATIVTPGIPPSEREALLGVLKAAIHDHNAEIRSDSKRGERPVMGHSRAYHSFRKWRLHVWELRGPSDTWGEQLESAMRAQPVFAVLSGVGRGAWQPIHDFCERREVPCLFPNTDRPPLETAFYSLYLSRGIALEADLVAHEIAQGTRNGSREVVQIFRDDDEGHARAQALRRSLAPASGVRLTDRTLARGGSSLSWSKLIKPGTTDVVLWLDRAGVAALGTAGRSTQDRSAFYLSSVLLGGPEGVPPTLRPAARVVHPFDLPMRWQPRRDYLERWLESHDQKLAEERVQANAYLAMNLFTRSLKHVREPFSQDYLIERIEHGIANSAWRSVYRELSLGSNAQRFASKGGYVIGWTGADAATLDARWVIPAVGESKHPVLTRVD